MTNRNRMNTLLIGVAATIALAMPLLANDAYENPRTSQNEIRHIDAVEWLEGTEGVSFGLLWGDWNTGPFGMIVKTEAGHTIPTHAHSHDYDGVTIQGNWGHVFGDGEDVVLPPGSYARQVRGDFHSDYCTGPEDCLVLIHQHGPRSFIDANE